MALTLGRNIDGDAILEGNDVYLDCKVEANPAPYKVTWWHEVRIGGSQPQLPPPLQNHLVARGEYLVVALGFFTVGDFAVGQFAVEKTEPNLT